MRGFCQRDNITNFTARPQRPQRGVYVSDLCGLCDLVVKSSLRLFDLLSYWDSMLFGNHLVPCPINNVALVASTMGRRQGGPSRTGVKEGAYLNRYVTDEQRRRRPISIATLRAVASWLFFRVAHSSRINSDMLVLRALKNSQLIRPLPDESHVIYGTGHEPIALTCAGCCNA
jgi:hypothetical protein